MEKRHIIKLWKQINAFVFHIQEAWHIKTYFEMTQNHE